MAGYEMRVRRTEGPLSSPSKGRKKQKKVQAEGSRNVPDPLKQAQIKEVQESVRCPASPQLRFLTSWIGVSDEDKLWGLG